MYRICTYVHYRKPAVSFVLPSPECRHLLQDRCLVRSALQLCSQYCEQTHSDVEHMMESKQIVASYSRYLLSGHLNHSWGLIDISLDYIRALCSHIIGMYLLITEADTNVEHLKLDALILYLICFFKSEFCLSVVLKVFYKQHQSIFVQIIHVGIIQINMNLYKC